MDDHARARVETLKVELDQCWDLLRQRRALREFGDDPTRASNVRTSTMPNTAIAMSPATRATALFTPDATPACWASTAASAVVVSGATRIAMPRPSTTMAGSTLVQ